MIVYNTTFHIDDEAVEEGLAYLKGIYIPKAMNSGFLRKPCLRRVLDTTGEKGESFAVQFHVKNIDTLNYWLEQEGHLLQQALAKQFGNKIAGFTTLLEEIDWEQ